MEIRIGVQHSPREVALETEQTADEVRERVATAIADGSLLRLDDAKGRTVLVPGDKIAFVEVGSQKAGPLGFAAR